MRNLVSDLVESLRGRLARLRSDGGVTAVEYAVLVALLGVVLVPAAGYLQDSMGRAFLIAAGDMSVTDADGSEDPAPAAEPTAEPEPEVVAEPAAEPEPEVVAEPAAEPEPEDVAEPAAEPEPEVAPEPAAEPVSETATSTPTFTSDEEVQKKKELTIDVREIVGYRNAKVTWVVVDPDEPEVEAKENGTIKFKSEKTGEYTVEYQFSYADNGKNITGSGTVTVTVVK